MKRIAITGPESTGKSKLAAQLANYYHTMWVPEYAREYLNVLHRPYDYADILCIAKMQFKMMKKAEKEVENKVKVEVSRSGFGTGKVAESEFLFFDTELLVTKIWCDVKFGKCHRWIHENINRQNIDFFLLMDIDLPWEADPLREHPYLRQYLFDMYKSELEDRNLRYAIISGVGEERLANAVRAIEEYL